MDCISLFIIKRHKQNKSPAPPLTKNKVSVQKFNHQQLPTIFFFIIRRWEHHVSISIWVQSFLGTFSDHEFFLSYCSCKVVDNGQETCLADKHIWNKTAQGFKTFSNFSCLVVKFQVALSKDIEKFAYFDILWQF